MSHDGDHGQRATSVAGRLRHMWAQLPPERRLAAGASLGLFISLFFPWYSETVIARGVTTLHQLNASFTGWGAFSFVEAAVLLVVVGVLTLLVMRAEGRPFHVPGGDGGVVTTAGAWTCILLIWRMFDKQGTTGYRQYATTSGVEWGIFVALLIAGVLTYAGTRIRHAHDPEPPLPGDEVYLGPGARPRASRSRWRRGGSGAGERAGSRRSPRTAPDAPTARRAAPDARTRPRAAPDADWGAERPGDLASWSPAPDAPPRRPRPPGDDDLGDAATEPLVQRLRPAAAAKDPRPGAPGRSRRPRALDATDVGNLGIDEPPTAPLRHRPGPGDDGDDGDEGLTARLDD